MKYEELWDLPLHEQLAMLRDEVELITKKANTSFAAYNALSGLADIHKDIYEAEQKLMIYAPSVAWTQTLFPLKNDWGTIRIDLSCDNCGLITGTESHAPYMPSWAANTAFDMLCATILEHAIQGLPVESEQYKQGVEKAMRFIYGEWTEPYGEMV